MTGENNKWIGNKVNLPLQQVLATLIPTQQLHADSSSVLLLHQHPAPKLSLNR